MPRDIHNDTNLSSLSTGNVYIADETGHRIRFVSVTTGNISTIAGNGNPGYNGDGITATSIIIIKLPFRSGGRLIR